MPKARYDGDVDGYSPRVAGYRSALEQAGGRLRPELPGICAAPSLMPVPRSITCRLMLVDEFRTSPAHLLLLIRLAAAGPGGAVFGVSDDDRTIYELQRRRLNPG
jgi:DNA helicase-2/ATP-dependent DNA helicase PcrA